MCALRNISDWFKYERLHHYPTLAAFDREAALKRLRAYEREERDACEPWFTMVRVLFAALLVVWAVTAYLFPITNAFIIVIQIPVWVLQFTFHRRIRDRVEAKVAAELRDGRLWKCVECDYDLRASETRWPECGGPVRIGLPEASTQTTTAASESC
jgi:hypothetical protein